MSILDRLNSGEIHAKARAARPNNVDALGNVHISPSRAVFIDWRSSMSSIHGIDPRQWPDSARKELQQRREV
jgi:hypothetical protein